MESQVDHELSIEEDLVEVDEHNMIHGSVKRYRVRKEGIWHRASYIYVMNSKGELCIHLRKMTKDFCPGYWDLCAGGCIQYGETDHENAKRELEEEYGIKGYELEFVSSFKYADDKNKCWGSVFFVSHSGKIIIQEEEIDEYRWVSLEDIQNEYIDDPDVKVTPDSSYILKTMKEHYSHLFTSKGKKKTVIK
ncbi:unnamed protein product [Moneuplotes crassus]|uniref:Nudix hydrolase domain-containing protein n=1 Tax=Euplotes crassus TaxID=5936 RepID=A0AAD1XXK1_EUPCR|nr:unnamed protein product [Moneuplotes crassus]